MMYVATEPGGSTVVQVLCDPLPEEFAGHYTYFPVEKWPDGVPQVGWHRNPITGAVAPPVRTNPPNGGAP